MSMGALIAGMIAAATIIRDKKREADLTARLEQATTLEDYKSIYRDSPQGSILKKKALDGWNEKFKEAIPNTNSLEEIDLLIVNTPPYSLHYEEIKTKRDKFYFIEKVQAIKNIDMVFEVYAYAGSFEMRVIIEKIYTFLQKMEKMTNPEDIETLLKTVSEDIRSVVEPIALARIEQLKSNPV